MQAYRSSDFESVLAWYAGIKPWSYSHHRKRCRFFRRTRTGGLRSKVCTAFWQKLARLTLDTIIYFSKFAAVGLSDALYQELDHLGKSGVYVTCVCPYFINTGMFDGVKMRMWASPAVVFCFESLKHGVLQIYGSRLYIQYIGLLDNWSEMPWSHPKLSC